MTEPAVIGQAVARVDATPEEIAAADIVILPTEHDAFLRSRDVTRHARHVLGCRRVLVPTSRRCRTVPNRTALGAFYSLEVGRLERETEGQPVAAACSRIRFAMRWRILR